MEEIKTHFKDKKNVITYLILAILVLAIPLSVRLVQTQQQLTTKAAKDEITCPEAKLEGGVCVTKTPEIKLKLDSPFGPAKP